jgi:hypothetical protein
MASSGKLLRGTGPALAAANRPANGCSSPIVRLKTGEHHAQTDQH